MASSHVAGTDISVARGDVDPVPLTCPTTTRLEDIEPGREEPPSTIRQLLPIRQAPMPARFELKPDTGRGHDRAVQCLRMNFGNIITR